MPSILLGKIQMLVMQHHMPWQKQHGPNVKQSLLVIHKHKTSIIHHRETSNLSQDVGYLFVYYEKAVLLLIRPRTFDLLVRISADSSKMDPTKIKNAT